MWNGYGIPQRNHESADLGLIDLRTAIARSVVGRPALVLADEPTGNLDSASGAEIIELLKDLNRDGTTIAVVTHNHELAAAMDRRIELKDGRIEKDTGAALTA